MSDKLSTWINQEIEERGWSIREFGRRAEISHTHAARIVNGEVVPSAEVCQNIARVFNIPAEEVLRIAGLLPTVPEKTVNMQELVYLFDQLGEVDQKNILAMLRGYVSERRGSYLVRQTPAAP